MIKNSVTFCIVYSFRDSTGVEHHSSATTGSEDEVASEDAGAAESAKIFVAARGSARASMMGVCVIVIEGVAVDEDEEEEEAAGVGELDCAFNAASSVFNWSTCC